MSEQANWPPEGHVAVGENYAFEPPNVPTMEQVEESEQFVFSSPHFEQLTEHQCRRNVMRLAIHHAFSEAQVKQQLVAHGDSGEHIGLLPLIGGNVKIVSRLHEGVVVREYEFLEG